MVVQVEEKKDKHKRNTRSNCIASKHRVEYFIIIHDVLWCVLCSMVCTYVCALLVKPSK